MRRNLTAKQAFYLTLFLRHRVNDELFNDARHASGSAGINVFGIRFNLNDLICIANGLFSTLEKK